MGLLVAAGVYVGSAIVSLNGLASAAKAGDGAAVLARTDTTRLRRSLVDQIVSAYLAQLGQNRPVKPLERLAANTYGATIADAMIAKMLTAENLTSILNKGEINAGDTNATMYRLSEIDASSVFETLKRISPTKPVEFAIKFGNAHSDGGVSMHFEGNGWKLSGIQLPPTAVQMLAHNLAMGRRGNG
ncbi:DUF2939 domain-containing protein [Bradyrhizobium sp. AS23.2]|uniref:DUF2939 domain-containing protein n=1 Tax=Bradyrhizobium sp. AS23.2 TaxID=1680155 RepID=UPI001FDA5453|nr:DUF2939 domain-containing protein [Bradyrhizobium sp. AS23.2]